LLREDRVQKIIIGVLTVLLLFFAAAHSRLADRQRHLEQKLSALEARPRPAAPKVDAAPEPPARTAAVAAVAAAPAPTPVLDQAATYLNRVFNDNQVLAAAAQTFKVLTRRSAQDLNLSESQKQAIESLRKNRDLQTQVYRDQIQKIEEQTELAIRQLLDSRQLQTYDAQGREERVSELLTFQLDDQPQAPEPPNPGYLGVTAENAPDGGAKIMDVLPDSAAKQFGLEVNDVVLEFNHVLVSNFSHFSGMIRSQPPGSYVTLRIRRGEHVFNQGVELGGRPK
jgi:hypothetical protein